MPHPFSLNPHLGTLAGGLGCSPLGNEAYPPLPDSHSYVDGIRSLIGIGTLVNALTHSVLYPHDTSLRLALKLFRREPDIAEFDWPFTPIHSSSPSFSTLVGSDLHPDTIGASSWPWIDHPVSGLPRITHRPR